MDVRSFANHYSVIPCEYDKFIKSSNQIPPRSDVAGYEDRKCEDGKRVHESLAIARASLSGASSSFDEALAAIRADARKRGLG